ncbi:hypothetical protein GCM10010215_55280 [Streptomyces virginiae]|uniref:Uncharacterized protein n=1 Tax=Streptomyces virginiae TaxID=1961 RepID=A0ABQ3NS42_STRVG|nr:hypothetical protein GCM10010215_55280 [Streptomyces virginiae]GHI15571.1 hypothetical protein Scinn_50340 [Streptomyces virginiae]GLV91007.1 hypothetical protein Slala04_24610 [Streptomyces lavendulae subsp. lavendulae]
MPAAGVLIASSFESPEPHNPVCRAGLPTQDYPTDSTPGPDEAQGVRGEVRGEGSTFNLTAR